VSYQVVVTFDLVNASSDNYQCVREELSSMGLYNFVFGRHDTIVDLPHNTFVGDLYGSHVDEIRDSIRSQMQNAFRRCGVRGPILVTVGGPESTWGTITV
jgi:hypothetical protein